MCHKITENVVLNVKITYGLTCNLYYNISLDIRQYSVFHILHFSMG